MNVRDDILCRFSGVPALELFNDIPGHPVNVIVMACIPSAARSGCTVGRVLLNNMDIGFLDPQIAGIILGFVSYLVCAFLTDNDLGIIHKDSGCFVVIVNISNTFKIIYISVFRVIYIDIVDTVEQRRIMVIRNMERNIYNSRIVVPVGNDNGDNIITGKLICGCAVPVFYLCYTRQVVKKSHTFRCIRPTYACILIMRKRNAFRCGMVFYL